MPGEVQIRRLQALVINRLSSGLVIDVQGKITLTRLGDGHDIELVIDQHQVAIPRHLQLLNPLQDPVDRYIDPGYAFKKVTFVDRCDGGHHPSLAGRVQVDIRPDHFSLRVMLGIGQVVEVVLGDVHVMGILFERIEPGINPVVAVPTVEIDAGNKRITLLQLLHHEILIRQKRYLVEILFFRRREIGIKRGGSAVVYRTVTDTIGA